MPSRKRKITATSTTEESKSAEDHDSTVAASTSAGVETAEEKKKRKETKRKRIAADKQRAREWALGRAAARKSVGGTESSTTPVHASPSKSSGVARKKVVKKTSTKKKTRKSASPTIRKASSSSKPRYSATTESHPSSSTTPKAKKSENDDIGRKSVKRARLSKTSPPLSSTVTTPTYPTHINNVNVNHSAQTLPPRPMNTIPPAPPVANGPTSPAIQPLYQYNYNPYFQQQQAMQQQQQAMQQQQPYYYHNYNIPYDNVGALSYPPMNSPPIASPAPPSSAKGRKRGKHVTNAVIVPSVPINTSSEIRQPVVPQFMPQPAPTQPTPTQSESNQPVPTQPAPDQPIIRQTVPLPPPPNDSIRTSLASPMPNPPTTQHATVNNDDSIPSSQIIPRTLPKEKGESVEVHSARDELDRNNPGNRRRHVAVDEELVKDDNGSKETSFSIVENNSASIRPVVEEKKYDSDENKRNGHNQTKEYFDENMANEKRSFLRMATTFAKKGFYYLLLGLAGYCLFVYVIVTFRGGSLDITNNDNNTLVEAIQDDGGASLQQPCFMDAGFAIEESKIIDCEGRDYVSCPKHGRCLRGELVDCLLNEHEIKKEECGVGEGTDNVQFDEEEEMACLSTFRKESLFVPSKNHLSCQLSDIALEQYLKVKQVLVDLTVKKVCGNGSGSNKTAVLSNQVKKDVTMLVQKNDSEISIKTPFMFAPPVLSNLVGLNEIEFSSLVGAMEGKDTDIILISPSLSEGESPWIGLSENYVNKNLPISASCYFRLLVWDMIKITFVFLSHILRSAIHFIYEMCISSPLMAILCAIIIYIYIWISKRRKLVFEMRNDVRNLRQIATDKLILDCNEGEGYAALHLRDEITHELFPDKCQERNHLMFKVWPKVVNEIRADNRVHKTNKSVGGKGLEWWEWISDASRNNRRAGLMET